MIEILQQYWQSYLWTDGLQMTGVAMTAWLLVLSIGIGFCLLCLYHLHEYQKISGCVVQFGCLLIFSWHTTVHPTTDYLLGHL